MYHGQCNYDICWVPIPKKPNSIDSTTESSVVITTAFDIMYYITNGSVNKIEGFFVQITPTRKHMQRVHEGQNSISIHSTRCIYSVLNFWHVCIGDRASNHHYIKLCQLKWMDTQIPATSSDSSLKCTCKTLYLITVVSSHRLPNLSPFFVYMRLDAMYTFNFEFDLIESRCDFFSIFHR